MKGDYRLQARYTSAPDELFHFVGYKFPKNDELNYENLGKILTDQCVSHAPHDNDWGKVSHTVTWDLRLETEELIVPTVTCFADIPPDSLSIHMSKYGSFGIALPMPLLVKYGARPVMYVPMRSDDWQSLHGRTLLRDIDAAIKGFNEHVVNKIPAKDKKTSRTLGEKPQSEDDAVSAIETILLKDFLAFLKPFNSELPINHKHNFYMEREWRKHGNMKFKPEDVTRIIVAKGFANRISNDFPEYSCPILEI